MRTSCPTASGFRRARHAARHPASRPGRVRTALHRRGARRPAVPAGSYVVVLRQPYAGIRQRRLLERSITPTSGCTRVARRYPPYDVTAHTLPLLMGVTAVGGARFGCASPRPPRSSRPPRARGFAASPAGGTTGRTVPLVCRADRRGVDALVVDTWKVPYRVGRRLVVRGEAQGSLRRDRPPGSVAARAVRLACRASIPRPTPEASARRRRSGCASSVTDGGTLVGAQRREPLRRRAPALSPCATSSRAWPTNEFYAPGSIFRLELDRATDRRGMPPSLWRGTKAVPRSRCSIRGRARRGALSD